MGEARVILLVFKRFIQNFCLFAFLLATSVECGVPGDQTCAMVVTQVTAVTILHISKFLKILHRGMDIKSIEEGRLIDSLRTEVGILDSGIAVAVA